ncbi:uncharacterized, partial [Tachysurus ichikawai]
MSLMSVQELPQASTRRSASNSMDYRTGPQKEHCP